MNITDDFGLCYSNGSDFASESNPPSRVLTVDRATPTARSGGQCDVFFIFFGSDENLDPTKGISPTDLAFHRETCVVVVSESDCFDDG